MRSAISVSIVWVLICLSVFSQADTLLLTNGDRLTGTVVKKETEQLIFETSYAGEIAINWEQVSSLTTENPVELVLSDQTVLVSSISSSQSGILTLKSDSDTIIPVNVNIDNVLYINAAPHITGKGLKFSGQVNGGINVSRGNTENEFYNLDTEMILRSIDNRFTAGAAYYKATENDTDTANEANLHLKYDHFLDKKQYLYGNSSFARDKFKDRKLKSTVGVGYGYQFLESDNDILALEGGINYVHEDFYEAETENYFSGRWALKFGKDLLEKVHFFHEHEGLVSVEDSDDVSITSTTGFKFPFYAGLNSSIQLNLDWDNTPSPGFKKTDKKYLFNLGYSW